MSLKASFLQDAARGFEIGWLEFNGPTNSRILDTKAEVVVRRHRRDGAQAAAQNVRWTAGGAVDLIAGAPSQPTDVIAGAPRR